MGDVGAGSVRVRRRCSVRHSHATGGSEGVTGEKGAEMVDGVGAMQVVVVVK